MAWIDHSDSLWESVPALSTTVSDQVIPNGAIWRIREMDGAAAYTPDASVCVVWDRGGAGEEILFATHGDHKVSADIELTGDGVKKLAICLTNDTASAQVLGGAYTAVEAPA